MAYNAAAGNARMLVLLVLCSQAGTSVAGGRAVRALSQVDFFGMDDSYTVATHDFDEDDTPAECTAVMAGCTGTIKGELYSLAGQITAVDDCTFRVDNWEFDGGGPRAPLGEWWVSAGDYNPGAFARSSSDVAFKIAELADEEREYVLGKANDGTDSVTVRLGLRPDGTRALLTPHYRKVFVWNDSYAIIFGSAVLTCATDSAAEAGRGGYGSSQLRAASSVGDPPATAPAPMPPPILAPPIIIGYAPTPIAAPPAAPPAAPLAAPLAAAPAMMPAMMPTATQQASTAPSAPPDSRRAPLQASPAVHATVGHVCLIVALGAVALL